MKYVSATNPQGCLIQECSNGSKEAAMCASAIFSYIDWLDNIIDKDVPISYEASAKTSLNFFMMLSYNKFWIENRIHLAPILAAAYNAWMDSEKLKNHSDYRVRISADVLKGYFMEVFYQIGFITGGYDLMRQLSEKWRGFDFDAKPDLAPAKTTKDASGYVDAPRLWTFPKDHHEHSDFSTEWWYFSGILESDNGNKYGYHLCEFRFNGRMTQHLSLIDIESGKLEFKESFQPSVVDFDVADRISITRLEGVNLEFKHTGDIFFQGKDGLSIKSDIPNHASYYYSIRHLRTSGTINGIPVKGTSWFDHEFGHLLKPANIKWAFFYSHMPSGATINGYLIIKDDKLDKEHSSLIYVDKDGEVGNFTGKFDCGIPTTQFPDFVIEIATKVKVIVSLITPISTCKSSLGEYLELPCEVTLLTGDEKETGFGYVEVTT